MKTQELFSEPHKRDAYDWLDMAIKTIGIILAVIAGFQASQTYKRDVDEKLLDQKLKVVNETLAAAGKLAIAPNWTSFQQALDELAVLKHGPAITIFGDDETRKGLFNYYYFCKAKFDAAPWDSEVPWDEIFPEYDKLSMVFHDRVLYPTANKLTK